MLQISLLPLLLVFFAQAPAPAVAQESPATLTAPQPPVEEARGRRYEIHLNSELRYLSTGVVQRRGQEGAELYELSTLMRFELDPVVGLSIDAGVESFDSESEFIFRKVELDFKPLSRLELRGGQTFIPLGFFTENDRWMSELPHYYRSLLPWEKGIDLGVRGIVRPFGNDWLMLDGSTYSGRMVRPGDERAGPAETRPTLLQVRSGHPDMQIFAALWEHDLAFRDRIEARGAGFMLKHEWKDPGLEPMLLAEGFMIEEKQKIGPLQKSLSGTAVAQVRWRRLTAGALYARSKREALVNNETFALAPVNERNLFAEARLHETFRVRVERTKITEDEKTVDDTVYRAIFSIQAL